MLNGERYVIIMAGGSGKRMGCQLPKQMIELNGKPILRHTVELFLNLPFKVEIIIVINPEIRELWKEYCYNSGFKFRYILTTGGITRFHSVKKGLKFVSPGSVVAIHDGVRPIVNRELLISLYEKASENVAVIPVTEVFDSMRVKKDGGKTESVDREKFLIVQTPQVFHSDVLIESYTQAYSTLFTDDASVVESKGYPLTFCDGSRSNIKITTQDDLRFALTLLGGEIVYPNLPFDGLV